MNFQVFGWHPGGPLPRILLSLRSFMPSGTERTVCPFRRVPIPLCDAISPEGNVPVRFPKLWGRQCTGMLFMG